MLDANNYRLRFMNESDCERVHGWRNLEHVRRNMYTDHIISFDEHRRWFNKTLHNDTVKYLIFEKDLLSIGLVCAVQIDYLNRKCYWGHYFGEIPVQYGPEIIRIFFMLEYLSLEYIFNELNMRKLCCEVFEFNKTVIDLHKKFGFIQEGIMREHVLKNGQYENVHLLSLLNHEWQVRKKVIGPKLFKTNT